MPWILLTLMLVGFTLLMSLSRQTQTKIVAAASIPTSAPTSAPTLADEAAAHQQQSKWAAAIESWRAHLIAEPQDANAFYQLGLILAVVDPEQAIIHLQQAARLDPQYDPAAERLTTVIRRAAFAEEPAYQAIQIGQALAAEDVWQIAEAAFLRATELNPDYAEAWAYLGQARQQIGRDGYPALEQALVLNPNSLAANVFMGLYWRQVGKPEVALIYLQSAGQLAPNNPAIETDIGNTLAEMGSYADALEHLMKVVELAPDNPNSWIALAEFSLHHEIQIEEIGQPAARQIILLDKNNPAGHALLGQAYNLLGDEFNAQKFMMKALQLDPEYAPAHYYLALYYLTQQQSQLAQQHLTQAVQFAGQAHADFKLKAQNTLNQYFPTP